MMEGDVNAWATVRASVRDLIEDYKPRKR